MAIAKPRTFAEQAKIDAALRRKYPQMQTERWKDSVAKARGKSKRTRKIESQLRKAGIDGKR